MMIEIGRKKAVCEYCDSELYIDEIVSDIKRDRNRDDREDENKVHHSGTLRHHTPADRSPEVFRAEHTPAEHTITERRSRTITRAIQHAPLI